MCRVRQKSDKIKALGDRCREEHIGIELFQVEYATFFQKNALPEDQRQFQVVRRIKSILKLHIGPKPAWQEEKRIRHCSESHPQISERFR
ncbi:hypothetical protein RB195_014526 [Necator americanus]|uniref:Uncharacterized protein n=1 Tax=Necator americanus TaxID=51031 RepID=A0ABR1E0J2_NECAM